MNFTIKCSHCNSELTVRSTGWEREIELSVDPCDCTKNYTTSPCSGCDSYDDGYEDGKRLGYDEGYKDGQAFGYTEGHDEGEKLGFDQGRDEGYSDGWDEGYASGYEAAESNRE